MNTKLASTPTESSQPVIFQSNFNDHSETINATQAWSLFFSGGKSKAAIGIEPMFGRFLTVATVAIVAVAIVSSSL